MNEHIILKQSFFSKQFEGNLDIIDKHINHIQEFDDGRVLSNNGGYQSNDITFGFDELIKSVQDGFKELNMKSQLANFWLNINKGTDSNDLHIHPFTHWSVVYYHKVCCKNSPLVFSSHIPLIHADKSIHIPLPQQILYFPGWYPHSVEPCNQTDHERISIAFNFINL
jgi:hypothetical protein